MSHTPGPWKLSTDKLNIYGTPVDGRGYGVVAKTTEYIDEERDSQEANARLIAAACNSYDKHCKGRAVECAEGDLLGELLAACKSGLELLLAALHDLERNPDDYGVVAMIQDALAPATTTTARLKPSPLRSN